MTLRCHLHWHNWTAWSLPYSVTMVQVHRLDGVEVGRSAPHDMAFQSRRCRVCGHEAQREIGHWTAQKASQ